MTKKGKFIALEGNDGSGKATQARMLANRFAEEGIAAISVDFPAYNHFFGAFIGECLAGKHGDFLHMDPKIVSMLYAFDRSESSEYIRGALAEGKMVIADRFSSSNQIHQGGKIADEQERAAFVDWIDNLEHEVLHIPRPDLILYLQVPVEMSLELLSKKRAAKNQLLGAGVKDMVEGDRAYLEHSHATADWLAKNQPNWRIIECIEAG
jgi:dTMP kinase